MSLQHVALPHDLLDGQPGWKARVVSQRLRASATLLPVRGTETSDGCLMGS